MLDGIPRTTQVITELKPQPKASINTNEVGREIFQISKRLERKFINLGIKERYFDLFLGTLSSKLNAGKGGCENKLSFYQKLESLENLPNNEQYDSLEDYVEEITQLYRKS